MTLGQFIMNPERYELDFHGGFSCAQGKAQLQWQIDDCERASDRERDAELERKFLHIYLF